MSDSKKLEPAFPLIHKVNTKWHDGMTLRDYFAAKAMAALINKADDCSFVISEIAATYAYKMADAMLKEREQ